MVLSLMRYWYVNIMDHSLFRLYLSDNHSMDLWHGRHGVFALHAYLVFVTKHRRVVLTADVSVRYFKCTLWTPSYFAAAAGGVTLEKVKKYVEEQRASSPAGMSGFQRGDFDEMTHKPRVFTPGH